MKPLATCALALALALALVAGSVCAQDGGSTGREYRIVRPDGTVEFTDQPSKGAVPIKIPKTQTFSLPPAQPSPMAPQSPSKPPPKPPAGVYTALTITSPADQSTLRNLGGKLPVSVNVQPQLRSGDRVIIYYDGHVAASGPTTHLTVHDVYRGAHTLRAAIEGPGGSTALSSPIITIYVHQHSILFKKKSKAKK